MKSFADVEAANGGKYPGFAVLRHVLSVVILLHHCRVAVRGVRAEPVADISLQAAGVMSLLDSGEIFRPFLFALVAAFFALSGFLVAGSAVRTKSMGIFLSFRALRILPALMSEVTLSAIVLGACLTTLPLAEYYSSPDFWRYFGNIAGFVTFYLPGVFLNNPISGIVNVNLWTLTPEFYCYLAMTALIGAGMFRRKNWLARLFIIVTIVLSIFSFPGYGLLDSRDNTTHFSSWVIVYMFFCGVAFYLFSAKIPYSPFIMAASGAIYLIGMLLRIPDILSCLALVYFTLAIGAWKFRGFDFLEKYDYSYGIYLYGYPIAQTLINLLDRNGLLAKTLPVYAFVMFSTLLLTLIFSALSWRFVEKPFLTLKRHIVKPRVEVAKQTNTASVASKSA